MIFSEETRASRPLVCLPGSVTAHRSILNVTVTGDESILLTEHHPLEFLSGAGSQAGVIFLDIVWATTHQKALTASIGLGLFRSHVCGGSWIALILSV